MRILFLGYEFPPAGGGSGRALRQLSHHLAELGARVDVVTLRGEEPGVGRRREARRSVVERLLDFYRRNVDA